MPGAIHPGRQLAAQPQFCAAVRNHLIGGCRVSLPEAGHRKLIHHAGEPCHLRQLFGWGGALQQRVLHGQRGGTGVGWSTARACGKAGAPGNATSFPDFHHAPGDFGVESASTFYPSAPPDPGEICPDIRHAQT